MYCIFCTNVLTPGNCGTFLNRMQSTSFIQLSFFLQELIKSTELRVIMVLASTGAFYRKGFNWVSGVFYQRNGRTISGSIFILLRRSWL